MIGTDEFLSLGKLESRSRGLPNLPFVITKHPLGGLRTPDVIAKAEALVAATMSAVCAGAAK